LIRTAEQILADIEAAGGEIEDEEPSRPAVDRPVGVPCVVDGCPKSREASSEFCRPHRWRLLKYGDVQADKPIGCRCGKCSRTIRKRNSGPGVKVELVGDVWLVPVV
jgi:hypothetical protein